MNKQRFLAFRRWQGMPHRVADLSTEEHDCTTCGTYYQGNYCPRCGQSARLGRYSMKGTFLNFLDVWGLGNRGMFRTLRDLLLRPGYMIRDYIMGMQMAYFPPFKMFFLLATLTLLIESGMNIKGENSIIVAKEKFEEGFKESNNNSDKALDLNKADNKEKAAGAANEKADETSEIDEKRDKMAQTLFRHLSMCYDYINDHQSIFILLWLLLFSVPLYLLFRHCPTIPDLYYPEFFITMVYITNQMTLLSLPFALLCIEDGIVDDLLGFVATVVTLKQFSGYPWLRTIGNVLAASACILILFFLFVVAATICFFVAYRSTTL
ncbi:MAG: DUF3667 domain-containing protein [Prevotella sp.]|nr:DUF3667 domain-containing protein [Prevotella sp.]